MASEGNGRLTFLLRPQKNAKGGYHMGKSNWKGSVDLSSKVIFAYPQTDGSLIISLEEYDEAAIPSRKRSD